MAREVGKAAVMRRLSLISTLLIAWLVALSSLADEDVAFREILSRLAPREPTDAVASFAVRDGFRIELVCAEPLVSDPIAIDFGPDGRLWVVEMGDYPVGEDTASADLQADYGDPSPPRGADPPRDGRVCYLEDSDRDGRFDRSTVFLDDLVFPTGVMVWNRGVLITCAPDIVYAEDTDGDGRADLREVLWTGFLEGNPQHRVNGLRWGLDNWIYGANGDSGGNITSLKTGRQVDIHARDFRLRPLTGEFQTQTGMAQYGRCRDDWGNWFGGRNLQPIWHCALDDQYLRRNPYLVPPDPCVDLLDPPTCAPVYPISTTLPRFNEFWTLNRFTSACGIAVYRDDLFGTDFAPSIFVCEPTYNLVHRAALHPRGVTFRADRVADEQHREFLASTDHWFRPVQARTGPDGALWIVDMYRLVIEHPDYIPEKWHAQLDFHAGRGRGRIYRVLPEGVEPRGMPSFAGQATPALVEALEDSNGPRRDMVQQMLIHRNDPAAVAPLRALALSSPRPQVRLSALATLDGLGAVDESLLLAKLEDEHGAVRRHAVRLVEPTLNQSARLSAALLRRLDDPDAQVRMQLAYTLGEWDDCRAGEALARIALQNADDRLLMAAVMSSATRFPDEMLRYMLDDRVPRDAQLELIENLLRLVWETGENAALEVGLQRITMPLAGRYAAWQQRLLASLLDVMEYRGQSLAEYGERASPPLRAAIDATRGLFEQATRDAVDASLDGSQRVSAIRLIGRGGGEARHDPASLATLLVPQEPVEVQLAVVAALARLAPPQLPHLLLDGWSQHGPQVRARVLDVLLSHESWAVELLRRVESGEVSLNEVDAVTRSRLILHNAAAVRRRAAPLFQQATPAERLATIRRYRNRLKDPADVSRGREVFRQHCAVCHRLEEEGANIGPDLLALTDRSPETLLLSVLDPNRAVDPRYLEYVALDSRGKVMVGMVTRETGNSLVLVDAQGQEQPLIRSEVVELSSTGKSLMPVGMELLLQRDSDLLDVIAYVRSVEPDPAGKRPAVESHDAGVRP